ncbi:vWA domain-containing protein [Mycolicibacterium arenosum]|uniref:VWA domain-containing protein n=1 Tax=Mycolicibacterium arenosum TaxID=2952157 RepID=A0ABT1M9W4_9MYCO|nr:VWA domain-containing protein [Mycolicibacterium sp. CAU 1645]MCP9275192.1 VWA domain-containing protein [Mycolicibacterium sp. CAU 1645]
MTDPARTLIAALLDRSGSMESIKSDSEGGFNALIADQRTEPGEARVTLAQFDTEYEVVYANRPIADVGPLVLQPRGMTALLDSVGRLITDVGAELSALPEEERPGKVIVVVVTDGMENSSTEWTVDAVKKVIKRQQDEYAWEFIFLGANMDAVEVGRRMGFAADRSMTFAPSPEGVAGSYRANSRLISSVRSAPAGVRAEGFTKAERGAARGADR